MAEQTLDEFFSQDPPPEDERELYSRRKFLSGAAAGGAAGLAIAAGTGVAVWNIVDEQAQADLEAAQAEIARLQGLVNLYENLEKIGLDAIISTGMKALALPLEAVELGAKALKSGLDWAEGALLSLKEALPTAQESILWLEGQVSAIADGIGKLEAGVGNALDKATDNAVAESLEDLANLILDNLPFGLGDKIREVLEGMVALVTSVDELVEGINAAFLEPMREKWFATEDGGGVGATFIDPLVEHVLDPVEAHLESLATLADTWQQELVSPAERALAERAAVREEIVRYREKYGLS
jgi:hypothetical protein